MTKREQACVDCHFFVHQFRGRAADPPHTMDVSEAQRELCRSNDFSWHNEHMSLMCDYGVWDQGFRFDMDKRYELIVDTERRDFCFFLPWHKGMFLPAARTLQERKAAQREAARDRSLTVKGLWIAAIALVANVILTTAALVLRLLGHG